MSLNQKRTETKSAFYTDMSFNKGIGDPLAIFLKKLPEDIPILSCPNPGQLNAYNVPTLMRWDVVYFECD